MEKDDLIKEIELLIYKYVFSFKGHCDFDYTNKKLSSDIFKKIKQLGYVHKDDIEINSDVKDEIAIIRLMISIIIGNNPSDNK